jgi:hypothetical protein
MLADKLAASGKHLWTSSQLSLLPLCCWLYAGEKPTTTVAQSPAWPSAVQHSHMPFTNPSSSSLCPHHLSQRRPTTLESTGTAPSGPLPAPGLPSASCCAQWMSMARPDAPCGQSLPAQCLGRSVTDGSWARLRHSSGHPHTGPRSRVGRCHLSQPPRCTSPSALPLDGQPRPRRLPLDGRPRSVTVRCTLRHSAPALVRHHPGTAFSQPSHPIGPGVSTRVDPLALSLRHPDLAALLLHRPHCAGPCPALSSSVFDLATQNPPPSFLLTPLTRETAALTATQLQRACVDSPTPALQAVKARLAAKAGHRITLDLFASTTNTFCPWYFSESPEHESEEQDALEQPNWAASFCPTCNRSRSDFVLLYPPFHLISRAVQKAQFDQAQEFWWHLTPPPRPGDTPSQKPHGRAWVLSGQRCVWPVTHSTWRSSRTHLGITSPFCTSTFERTECHPRAHAYMVTYTEGNPSSPWLPITRRSLAPCVTFLRGLSFVTASFSCHDWYGIVLPSAPGSVFTGIVLPPYHPASHPSTSTRTHPTRPKRTLTFHSARPDPSGSWHARLGHTQGTQSSHIPRI